MSSLTRVDLESFPSLKTFSLRHNNLTTIEDGSFDSVELLEYLNLVQNKITSLPSKVFARLTYLKDLILTHNQLTILLGDILPAQNSIIEFKVNHNQLNIIHPKFMRSLRNAKRIDLRNNSCIDSEIDIDKEDGKLFYDLQDEAIDHCFE